MTTYFIRITRREMARRTFHRYEVRADGRYVGEVFQFRPDHDSRPRWMAQNTDGTVYGWLTHLNSRKAAAAVLVSYDAEHGGGR